MFDGVLPKNFSGINTMPCFLLALLADDESGFAVLEPLSSCVWSDIIAVHEADLTFHGSFENNLYRHFSEVFKGL